MSRAEFMRSSDLPWRADLGPRTPLEAATDRLGVGVLVVDPDLHVLGANTWAQTLLSAGDPFTVTLRGVVARTTNETVALRNAVAGCDDVLPLRFSRGAQRSPIDAIISRLDRTRGRYQVVEVSAAVLGAAMNDAGQVVGRRPDPSIGMRAILIDAMSVRELGTLGGSFSGLGAGRDGGVTFLYDIGDFSVTSDLWWGLVSAAGPVGSGASQPLQYDSITAEGVIYDGLNPWVIPHAFGVSSYDVRLLMNVYDYSGTTNLNNQLVTMASVGIGPSGVVLPVTSDYRVRFEFQARPVGSLGAWDSVLDTFDSLNTFCTANCVVTSFNGQFWYEEAITAPEPASIGLFGMVLLAMGNRVRRRCTRPTANRSTNLVCS